jgi:hypothetical protein
MSEEQCRFFSLLFLSCLLTLLTVLPSFEGTWVRLSQVAVKSAQYNSRERQPHAKCLEGTRVDLLKYIHLLLDEDKKKNQLIWLHGTAGVGKSAVAFTVADRMKGLKVTEETLSCSATRATVSSHLYAMASGRPHFRFAILAGDCRWVCLGADHGRPRMATDRGRTRLAADRGKTRMAAD